MPIVFIIHGSPMVQKNDLMIKKCKTRTGKIRTFVGHSAKMEAERTRIGLELYSQYKKQGFDKPIDYLIEATMTFYVKKQHEPDYDNLPHIIWDAAQGVKIAKKGPKLLGILTNDKLVRKCLHEKIVEGDQKYHGEPRTEITIRQYIN